MPGLGILRTMRSPAVPVVQSEAEGTLATKMSGRASIWDWSAVPPRMVTGEQVLRGGGLEGREEVGRWWSYMYLWWFVSAMVR